MSDYNIFLDVVTGTSAVNKYTQFNLETESNNGDFQLSTINADGLVNFVLKNVPESCNKILLNSNNIFLLSKYIICINY